MKAQISGCWCFQLGFSSPPYQYSTSSHRKINGKKEKLSWGEKYHLFNQQGHFSLCMKDTERVWSMSNVTYGNQRKYMGTATHCSLQSEEDAEIWFHLCSFTNVFLHFTCFLCFAILCSTFPIMEANFSFLQEFTTEARLCCGSVEPRGWSQWAQCSVPGGQG